jgi:cytidylate kinase
MTHQIFIISGVARSGKSTLAYRLHTELGYSYLSTDDIRFMAEKRLTKSEQPFDRQNRNELVWPYLESLIRTRHKFGKQDDGFIFEGDILKPERLATLKDLANVKMLCMAFPNISVADKMQQIRQYKNEHDWTDSLSDAELEAEVSKLIARSQQFQIECAAANIQFIDTSNFQQGMAEAYNYFVA